MDSDAADDVAMETPFPQRIEKYHDEAPGGSEEKREEGVPNYIAICFALNFIMGAGFLANPFTMEKSGILVGVMILVLMTSLLYMTNTFLLDSMARAEALTRFVYLALGSSRGNGAATYGTTRAPSDSTSLLSADAMAQDYRDDPASDVPRASSTARLEQSSRRRSGRSASDIRAPLYDASEYRVDHHGHDPTGNEDPDMQTHLEDPPVFRLSRRKFELVELVELFVGRSMAKVYLGACALYLVGTTWSYGAIFGSAFASHVPLPFISSDDEVIYRVYLALFAVIVLTIASFDLKEQVALQMSMTAIRVLIIATMFVTVVAAMATGDEEAFGKDQSVFKERKITASYLFFGAGGYTMAGIARMVPIAVYSQLFHTGIPVLSQPVRDKARVHNVFFYTYVATTTLYITMSTVIVLYFGDNVKDSANINWHKYTGNGLKDTISYIVVLFPALDVLTICPINIIALASNVIGAIYGERAAKVEADEHKKVVVIRLLCGFPPIIGAMITHKLATVLDYTGVLGLVIALVMPAILWERSLRAMVFIWGLPGASASLPRLPREAGGKCAKHGSRVEDADRTLLMGALQWILGSHEPDPADESVEMRQLRDSEQAHLQPSDAATTGEQQQPRMQEGPKSKKNETKMHTGRGYLCRSPYGGWWSSVWCARVVLIAAFVVGIFAIAGLAGGFDTPDSRSPTDAGEP